MRVIAVVSHLQHIPWEDKLINCFLIDFAVTETIKITSAFYRIAWQITPKKSWQAFSQRTQKKSLFFKVRFFFLLFFKHFWLYVVLHTVFPFFFFVGVVFWSFFWHVHLRYVARFFFEKKLQKRMCFFWLQNSKKIVRMSCAVSNSLINLVPIYCILIN